MSRSIRPESSQTGMRRPLRPLDPRWERAPLVLGRGHRFDGLLACGSEARVDGELLGEIVSCGALFLGERARVCASIEADEVIVAGEIEGDITARRRIELLATARVRGHLKAPRVALADGCVVHGRCVAGGSAAQVAEPSALSRKTSSASP